MNTANLAALLDRLRAESRESEWLEFKQSQAAEFVATVAGLGSAGARDGGVTAW